MSRTCAHVANIQVVRQAVAEWGTCEISKMRSVKHSVARFAEKLLLLLKSWFTITCGHQMRWPTCGSPVPGAAIRGGCREGKTGRGRFGRAEGLSVSQHILFEVVFVAVHRWK